MNPTADRQNTPAAPRITELAQSAGFTRHAVFNTAILRPIPEVREMCRADRCREYGKNWACPPACGTLEHCEQRIRRYVKGILVQTTGELEDEFDADGIHEAERRHKKSFATLVRQVRILDPDCLPLSAGTCTLCESCTCPDRPCRFPKKRLSSMEAFGLLVSDVCRDAGLGYYYGPGTITFSSCILLKKGVDLL